MDWIFGYGSIIWRPDFAYTKALPASVRGWRRRFWQGSPDHRGTPENPGRVVTLVEEPGAVCHGIAFRIEARHRERILRELDERESGGYVRLMVDVELTDRNPVSALTYFAPPDNANFLGPANFDALIGQIRMSAGASGENEEYALRLAEALYELDIHDPEVQSIARHLRRACSVTIEQGTDSSK